MDSLSRARCAMDSTTTTGRCGRSDAAVACTAIRQAAPTRGRLPPVGDSESAKPSSDEGGAQGRTAANIVAAAAQPRAIWIRISVQNY